MLIQKEEEERARKDRMKNIIVYGIKKPEGTKQVERQTEDIKETQWIFQDNRIGEDHVRKVICLGKYEETKKRPLLKSIKTREEKKLFQNLHKLRQAPDSISVTHDTERRAT